MLFDNWVYAGVAAVASACCWPLQWLRGDPSFAASHLVVSGFVCRLGLLSVCKCSVKAKWSPEPLLQSSFSNLSVSILQYLFCLYEVNFRSFLITVLSHYYLFSDQNTAVISHSVKFVLVCLALKKIANPLCNSAS